MAAPEGNTFSSRNNRLLTDTLRRVALSGDGEKVRRVCEEVFKKAEDGDLAAANFIFDRLEGKPSQAIDLGSDPDRPLIQKLVRELVRPDDKDR